VSVNGLLGLGGWDFIDLNGWATGEMSGVISDLGQRDTRQRNWCSLSAMS
jgi:hypothetical protein